MVIYWYLNQSMYKPPNPKKPEGSGAPFHPWGVEVINKMANYLGRHRIQSVDALLLYSSSDTSTPMWLRTVMEHGDLNPVLAKTHVEVLADYDHVRSSIRNLHQHSGNTVIVVATQKHELSAIENVHGKSRIQAYLNLIGPGGGGVRKRSNETNTSPELWDTI